MCNEQVNTYICVNILYNRLDTVNVRMCKLWLTTQAVLTVAPVEPVKPRGPSGPVSPS